MGNKRALFLYLELTLFPSRVLKEAVNFLHHQQLFSGATGLKMLWVIPTTPSRPRVPYPPPREEQAEGVGREKVGQDPTMKQNSTFLGRGEIF